MVKDTSISIEASHKSKSRPPAAALPLARQNLRVSFAEEIKPPDQNPATFRTKMSGPLARDWRICCDAWYPLATGISKVPKIHWTSLARVKRPLGQPSEPWKALFTRASPRAFPLKEGVLVSKILSKDNTWDQKSKSKVAAIWEPMASLSTQPLE